MAARPLRTGNLAEHEIVVRSSGASARTCCLHHRAAPV